ncbi:MAG TPA: hypothetical protein VH374_12280 [Polyangia bacterium]|jgi:hypothetical protein|nr:hypothetical protein [Polyangia bacterium]
MTCPDIYLGPSRLQAPPTPFWTNPAIAPPSDSLTQGSAVTIQVTARNHGTDDAPSTQAELYWSDPTTGFMAVAANLIGSYNFPSILGATTIPAMDGEVAVNFPWTPPAAAVTTNGGHVCLLARLHNLTPPSGATCAEQIYSADPPTDPLSAIHNIHVYAPPGPPPPPPAGGGGGGGNRRMFFAFAATNTLRDREDTKLLVRVLDPAKDRAHLEALIASGALGRTSSRCCVKFGLPKAVLVAEGRERVVVAPEHLAAARSDAHVCVPRLGRLGPLNAERAKVLVAPGTSFMEPRGAHDLKLIPGELRQIIIQVEPCDRDNVIYAVEVDHRSSDGHPIGGLVVVFVPPQNFF